MDRVKHYLNLLGNPFSILFLTSIGYLAFYYYKVGSYAYFGIPAIFIDFSTQNIVFVFTFLILISTVFVYAFRRIITEFKVITKGTFLLFAIIMISFFMQIISEFLSIIFILLSMLVGSLLYKLRYKKVVRFCKIDLLFKKIEVLTFADMVFIFIAVVSLIFPVWSLGLNNEKNGSYNMIVVKNKAFIVVDEYKDNLLILPIDIRTKIVKKQLYIYKIEDLNIDKSSLILSPIKIVGAGN